MRANAIFRVVGFIKYLRRCDLYGDGIVLDG